MQDERSLISQCGHCKNMKPAYEKVAKAFASEPNVVLAQVENADKAENKPLTEQYGVSSYPTLIFFPKGGAEHEKYVGGRTEEAFVEVSERSTFHKVEIWNCVLTNSS